MLPDVFIGCQMVIVIVVVVLAVVGVGVAFAMRSKKGGGAETTSGSRVASGVSVSGSSSSTVSSADRLAAVIPEMATPPAITETPIRHAGIASSVGSGQPEPQAPQANRAPQAPQTPHTPQVQPVARGVQAGETVSAGVEESAGVEKSTAAEEDEPVLDRFAARGQRSTGTTDYRATTPRKTDHLSGAPTPQLETPNQTPEPESEPIPVEDVVPTSEPVEAVEPVLEPEPELLVTQDPVPEPEPEIDPVVEPEPVLLTVADSSVEPAISTEPTTDSEPVIDLVSAEESVGAEPLTAQDGLAGEDDRQGTAAAAHVDMVLQALISRVRATDADVADVAEELVERAGLDAEEMAEVLTDLVERVESDHGISLDDRSEELTLFSEQVPRRPGQITAFADLGTRERRRVIIRVLCLLVARSEENKREAVEATLEPQEDQEQESRNQEGQWPLARAVWPSANTATEDEADLPARRNRLARMRR